MFFSRCSTFVSSFIAIATSIGFSFGPRFVPSIFLSNYVKIHIGNDWNHFKPDSEQNILCKPVHHWEPKSCKVQLSKLGLCENLSSSPLITWGSCLGQLYTLVRVLIYGICNFFSYFLTYFIFFTILILFHPIAEQQPPPILPQLSIYSSRKSSSS